MVSLDFLRAHDGVDKAGLASFFNRRYNARAIYTPYPDYNTRRHVWLKFMQDKVKLHWCSLSVSCSRVSALFCLILLNVSSRLILLSSNNSFVGHVSASKKRAYLLLCGRDESIRICSMRHVLLVTTNSYFGRDVYPGPLPLVCQALRPQFCF